QIEFDAARSSAHLLELACRRERWVPPAPQKETTAAQFRSRDYFFLDAGLWAGAAPHGVVFRFSTFAFSVSMVNMNGSLVNAFGTPVHCMVPPVSGLPVRGAFLLELECQAARAEW